MALRQALLLAIVSGVISLGVNFISPGGIPLVGDYYEFRVEGGVIVPPTAEAGDPPFIAADRARAEFELGTALFIDAREPEEFACGTIRGSLSLPFEYLPAENLASYIDSVLGGAPPEQTLIAFCSGEECDLSLHLARNLQALGYRDVLIFFGGAREWEKLGFEMERRADCGD